MTEKETTIQSQSFRLKGGLYTLTAIQLLTIDLEALKHDLEERIQQAPKFFHNAPVVIDLVKVNSVTKPVDFAGMQTLLRNNHLVPVGVRAGSPSQNQAAQAAGLATLPEAKIDKEPTDSAQKDTTPTPIPFGATKLITQPVRSGQQIYAKDADLIITASVSPGAEILADGHIHVYGPLRGRALAGVHGHTKAHIFCLKLEAELVSIAGQYRMRDDFPPQLNETPVKIFLEDQELHITEI